MQIAPEKDWQHWYWNIHGNTDHFHMQIAPEKD